MSEFQLQFLEKIDLILDVISNDKSQLINIVNTLVGVVVGAVVGTTATLFAQRFGSLKLSYLPPLKIDYIRKEGAYIKSVSIDDDFAEIIIEIIIDIYNSSQRSLGLRDSEFFFKRIKDNTKLSHKQVDVKIENAITDGDRNVSNIINIEPSLVKRVIFTLHFVDSFKSIKELIRKHDYLYFQYKGYNNKKHEIKLAIL
jgi:hypothetical protein